MAVPSSRPSLEKLKFVESTEVPGQVGIVLLNPDGSNLAAGGGSGITQLTGDVTAGPGSGSEAATIPNGTVTYAKMQDVSATDKLLGRSTAGAGDVEEITCTAAGRALLDDADASAQRTTLGLGTIATQAANNVSITGGSITGITDIAVADGGTGSSTAAGARTNLGLNKGRIAFVIDGGGSAILTGRKGAIHLFDLPASFTITGVSLLADVSGSIVIDILKNTYTAYDSGETSICASAKPTISSAVKSKDTTLTGWTTALASDDVLEFNVDSIATITRVTLTLSYTF